MEQAILRHESSREAKGFFLLFIFWLKVQKLMLVIGHTGGEEETGRTHPG
jgi:hypothetical protein